MVTVDQIKIESDPQREIGILELGTLKPIGSRFTVPCSGLKDWSLSLNPEP
jgi:hypothetical protein